MSQTLDLMSIIKEFLLLGASYFGEEHERRGGTLREFCDAHNSIKDEIRNDYTDKQLLDKLYFDATLAGQAAARDILAERVDAKFKALQSQLIKTRRELDALNIALVRAGWGKDDGGDKSLPAPTKPPAGGGDGGNDGGGQEHPAQRYTPKQGNRSPVRGR